MPKGPDMVSVQTYLKQDLVKRIDELAKRMGLSRSTMAARLLEAGVDDNEKIIKVVTHPQVVALVRKLAGLGGEGVRERRQAAVQGD